MLSGSLVSLETMLCIGFLPEPALSEVEGVEMTQKACRGGVHPRPREGIKPSPTQHLVGTMKEGSKGQRHISLRQ